jgi:tyrosyl-tRNA synthetase
MTKTITDKKKIDDLLTRGVEKIYPDRETLEKKLLKGERIKLYCGFDPTAPSMHIGNAITINKLAQFQALGHEVVFLVGGFTCMIGDPTDKAATRKKMSREEVMDNAKSYKDQASAYLDFEGDNPAQLLNNAEWSDKLSFKDLIELSSNFTVQQMIQRDMFQKRLKEEKPIHLHEFLYPLAQAYDSVAMDVDLELGGNDQMFNMMAGRDLMKAKGMRDKCVMTLKILEDEKGNKMGKSEGNAVFLDETPENMYGIIMSWPDGFIAPAFELATRLSFEEVKKIQTELKKEDINPRDLKMKLAFEMVKINHSEADANKAQDNFIKTIQKKEIPDEINEIKPSAYDIATVLLESKAVTSKSEARRVIEQGGVKVNQEKLSDLSQELKPGDIIQKGKVFYIKVV